LLSRFDSGADSGLGEDAAETVTTGPDAFDEGSLWNEFDLHLAGYHLPLGFRVKADMARYRLTQELRVDEFTDASARLCRIVRDDCEISFLLAHDFINNALGRTHTHEAADH
jgi:hypothetical protein